MGVAIVQSRGQLTVPREEREKAEIKPGDRVLVRTEGEHKLSLRVIPGVESIDSLYEPYRREGKADLGSLREDLGDRLVEEVSGAGQD